MVRINRDMWSLDSMLHCVESYVYVHVLCVCAIVPYVHVLCYVCMLCVMLCYVL